MGLEVATGFARIAYLFALIPTEHSGLTCGEMGGPRRDRTDDPRIKSPLLYRLS